MPSVSREPLPNSSTWFVWPNALVRLDVHHDDSKVTGHNQATSRTTTSESSVAWRKHEFICERSTVNVDCCTVTVSLLAMRQ